MSEEKNENNKSDESATDDIYKRLNAFRPPEHVLKKHPCKDCFNCLFCGDARCAVCLKSKNCSRNTVVVLKKSDE